MENNAAFMNVDKLRKKKGIINLVISINFYFCLV